MNERTVVLTIPAAAEHLSLLRAVVGYYAGREQFTIDQIDDLRMAVDESGVQLLRKVTGPEVRLELRRQDAGIVVQVSAEVGGDAPIIDRQSFSWTILQALSDELEVVTNGTTATVTLAKHRPGPVGGAHGGGG